MEGGRGESGRERERKGDRARQLWVEAARRRMGVRICDAVYLISNNQHFRNGQGGKINAKSF